MLAHVMMAYNVSNMHICPHAAHMQGGHLVSDA